MKVLVIDDEESMRHMLSVLLKRAGYEVETAANGEAGLCLMEADAFDFVLCDVRMPVVGGLEFLGGLKARGLDVTVIMMSAYAAIDTAIECLKAGAYDFVTKPFKTDEVILTLKKAEERERLRRENARLREAVELDYDSSSIYTVDEGMKQVLRLAGKVAPVASTVLITGESGTGKELFARAIHALGERATRPFVAINCGAIPAQLLESELFGHVKGAFTDAHRTKAGLFQEADGGTLFLDEVGELPLELQVKLLRVLQEGEVRKVGDTRVTRIDTRVLAATIKDLKEEVKKGSFREDLFYRLNVVEIKLPPLRERRQDIPGLCALFVDKYARKFGKRPKAISKEAMEAMLGYAWPGNVRELENAIERAMILAEGDAIGISEVPVASAKTQLPLYAGLSIKAAHEAMEKELIKKALETTKGNRTKAATLLEISHRALLYKIKSFGL